MKQLWDAKILNGFRSHVPKGYYDPIKGHTGIDLAFKFEKIYAPCDLEILKNNTQKEMGRTLYCRDSEGLIHCYAHLLSFLYPVGSKVLRGQALAISGNSGTKGIVPHLHFEMLAPSGTNPKMERNFLPFKGDNVDPTIYLSKWKDEASKNEANDSQGDWIASPTKKEA
jgi:murein DD-endopeptidase MepM/ murein hydrolase activator NlpD